jgi:hypothetical protein
VKQVTSIADEEECLRCRLFDAGLFLDFNSEDGGGIFLRKCPFQLIRYLSQNTEVLKEIPPVYSSCIKSRGARGSVVG